MCCAAVVSCLCEAVSWRRCQGLVLHVSVLRRQRQKQVNEYLFYFSYRVLGRRAAIFSCNNYSAPIVCWRVSCVVLCVCTLFHQLDLRVTDAGPLINLRVSQEERFYTITRCHGSSGTALQVQIDILKKGKWNKQQQN